ncbi:MAG: penicillin-binding transpeptidase domain-containing protein [Candidatus Melainabacteria bacterium]|nr:penicillin-binding transpeptidase domain-containing protein [Candidatus Melainabacteria bacterium]
MFFLFAQARRGLALPVVIPPHPVSSFSGQQPLLAAATPPGPIPESPLTGPYSNSHSLSRRAFLAQALACLASMVFSVGLSGCRSTVEHPSESIQWRQLRIQTSAGGFWWCHLSSPAVVHQLGTLPDRPEPCGSTLKLVTALYLLERGHLHPSQRYPCAGSVALAGGETLFCEHPHGSVSVVEALAVSCNVFFARAVASVSPRDWSAYLQTAGGFRAGQANAQAARWPTDVRFPQAALGLDPAVSVTARQWLGFLAQWLNPPTATQPKKEGTLASRLVQAGMQRAVLQGTAQGLDPLGRMRVAAKTGTVRHGQRLHGWVVGYAPFHSPRVAFCARQVGHASREGAVLLARDCLESLL